MKKIIFILYLFSNLLSYSIDVAPATYIYQIDKGIVAQEVSLLNKNSKPERIKIYFKPIEGDSSERDLSKWAIVYPKIVNINPGQEKIIKFAIEAPKELQNIEYRGFIVFEELEDKAFDIIEDSIKKKDSSTAQVNFLITMEVAVYGYTKDKNLLRENFKISDRKVFLKNNIIRFNLLNNGEITKAPKVVIEYLDTNGVLQTLTAKTLAILAGKDENVVVSDFKNIKYKKILKVNVLDSNSILLDSVEL